MTTGRRLVLLRHGRTSWNAAGRAQGHADVELDDLGHQQARAAASALAVVVATIGDLGLTQFTVRRLAAEAGFADEHFGTLLPLRALLTVLALAALLAVGWVVGYRAGQLQVLAAVNPFTYAVHALRSLLVKNSGFAAITGDLLYLLLFSAIAMTAATLLFKRTL